MNKIPKFEKRHFEYLAKILQTINVANKKNTPSISKDFLSNINSIYIDYFANQLSLTNDYFDIDKFKESCNAK